MNKAIYAAALLWLVFATSCEYSKHPIDGEPLVKVDQSLYGIWKMTNATNPRDFILVQDGAHASPARAVDPYRYLITLFDSDGTNRHYENFDAYLSQVGRGRFLNVVYRNTDEATGEREEGFLLYRIISVNSAATRLTLARVADPLLKDARNAAEVRERVTANIANKGFYRDTVELYSVGAGHFTQSEAKTKANQ